MRRSPVFPYIEIAILVSDIPATVARAPYIPWSVIGSRI